MTHRAQSAAAESTGAQRALRAARAAAQTALANHGSDVLVLDMRPLSQIFDYFVLVTCDSRRQLKAVAEEIDQVMRDVFHDRPLGREGTAESHWILLDYGDVVVHLFESETRRFYALEQLWAEARVVPLESAA